MGLKPTQYRCASEALLRRYRKERSLPSIHPLIDLCNAISLAYAIPVAALDVDQIVGSLQVRYADGTESYLAFSGETEQPYAGEVIFADDARNVHARRWTNRQSALSAVSAATTTALIVAEAMHESAAEDVRVLIATIAAELSATSAGCHGDRDPQRGQPALRIRRPCGQEVTSKFDINLAGAPSRPQGQPMPTRSFPLDPTPIHVPGEVLDDLRRRLTATRWPLDAGNDDGWYGVRRAYLQELVGVLGGWLRLACGRAGDQRLRALPR